MILKCWLLFTGLIIAGSGCSKISPTVSALAELQKAATPVPAATAAITLGSTTTTLTNAGYKMRGRLTAMPASGTGQSAHGPYKLRGGLRLTGVQ